MDDTVVMRMARKAELDRNFIANSTGGGRKSGESMEVEVRSIGKELRAGSLQIETLSANRKEKPDPVGNKECS